MAFFPADMIQSAASFMLIFIDEAPGKRFLLSRLLNESEEHRKNLAEWFKFDDDTFSPMLALRFALRQLIDAGLIEFRNVTLPDSPGKSDTLLLITHKGIRLVQRGRSHICHSVNY